MKWTNGELAGALFWINFLPTLIAIPCMAGLVHDALFVELSWHTILIIPIVAGIIAQIIYLMQYRSERHANNRYMWIYSLIINALWISGYLIGSITTGYIPVLYLIFYPAGFFYTNLIAIRKIKRTYRKTYNLIS